MGLLREGVGVVHTSCLYQSCVHPCTHNTSSDSGRVRVHIISLCRMPCGSRGTGLQSASNQHPSGMAIGMGLVRPRAALPDACVCMPPSGTNCS